MVATHTQSENAQLLCILSHYFNDIGLTLYYNKNRNNQILWKT